MHCIIEQNAFVLTTIWGAPDGITVGTTRELREKGVEFKMNHSRLQVCAGRIISCIWRYDILDIGLLTSGERKEWCLSWIVAGCGFCAVRILSCEYWYDTPDIALHNIWVRALRHPLHMYHRVDLTTAPPLHSIWVKTSNGIWRMNGIRDIIGEMLLYSIWVGEIQWPTSTV